MTNDASGNETIERRVEGSFCTIHCHCKEDDEHERGLHVK